MCGEAQAVTEFMDFLDRCPHPHKIVIGGNHDVLLSGEWYEDHWRRYHSEKCDWLTIKNELSRRYCYLEDSDVVLNSIRIYGSPWVPAYHDWAFNLYESEHLRYAWDLIPAGVDVLVTHTPPMGFRSKAHSGTDLGCPELAKAVKRVKPAVHVFGHVHASYGVTKGATTYINAANVNANYKPSNAPIVFDLT